jgi:hypothetical protein
MTIDDVNNLVEILAGHADASPVSPPDYYRDLVDSSRLPGRWKQEVRWQFKADARIEARRLVNWAISKKVNPDDVRYTALGALLHALMQQELSPDEARTVVATLVVYRLIPDDTLLDDIKLRYRVPVTALAKAGVAVGLAVSYGPDIDWRGPAGDVELQGFFTPPIPWQDIGFLKRAIECASSVCRVEIDDIRGTGFLIAPRLVLTNFHVLKPTEKDDIEANARKAILRFGAFTAADGNPTEGQTFKLAQEFIVERSSDKELDFVLLRVEDKIQAAPMIKPVLLSTKLPAQKSALNIIHHPAGDTMKLSTSGNGVSGVYTDSGLVQYVTQTVEGSSGSPCFNDEWNVVALHHAQRALVWGSIREGILIQSIKQLVGKYL